MPRGESVARCQHGVLTPTRLMSSESHVDERGMLVQEWTCVPILLTVDGPRNAHAEFEAAIARHEVKLTDVVKSLGAIAERFPSLRFQVEYPWHGDGVEVAQ